MAKQKSLFIEYISKYFQKIDKYIETANGKRGAIKYLFEEVLERKFSPDQKWSSAALNNHYVVADVVEMDSPFPLKMRDSLERLSGDLPTLGMKLFLGKKQLSQLEQMIAMNMVGAELVNALLADSVRCFNGVKERIEMFLLEALSNGYAGVDPASLAAGGAMLPTDSHNMVRVDFGYLDENKFGVAKKWSVTDTNFDPIADIERVISANSSIRYMFISKKMFTILRKSNGGKQFFANYNGAITPSGAVLPTPLENQMKEAFATGMGVNVIVIDREFYAEKNGKRSKVSAWNDDHIIFTTTEQVGSLVYANVIEDTHPVNGVDYAKPAPYALISKWSTNDPTWQEFTQIEAMVLPVIENVDITYMLDTQDAEVVNTEREASDTTDQYTTIEGKQYTKSHLAFKFEKVGVTISANATDAEMIAAFNSLSKKDKQIFLDSLN